MTEQIRTELKRIEKENDIQILYAVESGSRAWGFASTDSDWDVRFLYIQNPNWYLSIDDKKDNMEVMLPNDLDFAGWELFAFFFGVRGVSFFRAAIAWIGY